MENGWERGGVGEGREMKEKDREKCEDEKRKVRETKG
jgi:hypothetical protein